MMHYGYGNMGFLGGGIYMILFWILLIVGIIYLISRSNISFQNNSQRHQPPRSNYQSRSENNKSPEEIAKERFAKGQIEKEELNEILNELRK